MPFTFSHPVAVLPLRILPRHWFSFSGLVIGSMAPDFEFFLRLNPEVWFSHTVAGIFLFGLPVGIVIAYVFYNIIATPLIDNLPAFLSSRLSFLQHSDWNTYFKNNRLKVCLCIIAGAISHVTWDNFTHEHGHFARSIPGLPHSVEILGSQRAIYHVLQHLSTIVGALIIAVYVWLLPVVPQYKPAISLKYWGMITVVFVPLLVLRFYIGLGPNWINNLAVCAISAALFAVTLASFLSKPAAFARQGEPAPVE